MINSKYKDLFYKARRATSKTGKSVMIVRDEKLNEFLDVLINDEDIAEIYRLLFATLYCGGCRVSEALALKKSDIIFEDGYYTAKVKVLKKKDNFELKRDIVFSPSLNELIEKTLKSLKPQEFVFKERVHLEGKRASKQLITRNKALRKIKACLGSGLDLHSLRHSNVALLMANDLTDIQISKTLELSLKMVANYSHINQKKTLKSIFKD